LTHEDVIGKFVDLLGQTPWHASTRQIVSAVEALEADGSPNNILEIMGRPE